MKVDPCRALVEEWAAHGCAWKYGVKCPKFTRKTKDWCLGCRAEKATKVRSKEKKVHVPGYPFRHTACGRSRGETTTVLNKVTCESCLRGWNR